MRKLLLIYTTTLLFACQSDPSSSGTEKKIASDGAPLFEKLDPNASGVHFSNTIKESEDMHYFLWESIYNGAGVGLGDINNDGLDDIFLTGNFTEDKLFLNKGNLLFEDIGGSAGISGGNNISTGVTFGDVNGDGYLDIYVCKFGPSEDPNTRINLLYINNHDNTFTESAKKYGVDNPGYSIQSAFIDYDLDGDLDLFVLNQPSNARKVKQLWKKKSDAENTTIETSDRLFRNDGNRFTDVSDKAGITNFAFGLGVNVSDINGDGWPDIFIANDYNKPDQYMVNQGDGTFKDIALSAFNHISNFSMGTDVADINNDGLLDIGVLDMAGANHFRSKTNMPSMRPKAFYSAVSKGYHYQYMHNTLQVNQGDDKFSDLAHLAGIAKTDWSWSLLMADFDNDTHRDIFVSNGVKRDIRNNDWSENLKREITASKGKVDVFGAVKKIPSTPMDNYLYHNDGFMHFTDKAKSWGLSDKGFSNGAAYGDLDQDGDLDLVVSNVDANVSIFKNLTVENKGGNSLRIQVTNAGKTVMNAKVAAYVGNQTFISEINPCRGYMSNSEAVAHFGIGNAIQVDSCVILWPNHKESLHLNLIANKTHLIDIKEASLRNKKVVRKQEPLFVNNSKIINHKHTENEFDPFEKQLLLPYEPSELGPFISKGDINGDGKEDVFIGGSKGFPGQLFIGGSSSLKPSKQVVFTSDKGYEDQRSLFFDADGDGDQDLYVCSGGYEFNNNKMLTDRLYINDGGGNLSKAKRFPKIRVSTSTVLSLDLEGDGDLDLAVFGRIVPGEYPKTPKSYLLINEGGTFSEAPTSRSPDLATLGMITDAAITDVDLDGDQDIICVGEWMSPKLLKNNEGTLALEEVNEQLSGLYFSVTADDIDLDGDDDYILGNLGTNNKWKASKEKPFRLYANDFDQNGNYDIVLANYSDDQVVPVRGRQCSSEQLPEISDKFKTFEEFATASVDEIYDLDNAQNLEAMNFKSGILKNQNGTFVFEPFDHMAQRSPINASIILDLNKDGKKDIVAVGNLFSTEVETTRFDAGIGSVILNENGKYNSIPAYKSGIYANKDAKDMLSIQHQGKTQFIIVNNNDNGEVWSLK